jgi:hypothetical protein
MQEEELQPIQFGIPSKTNGLAAFARGLELIRRLFQ